jgi:hypothetical protein
MSDLVPAAPPPVLAPVPQSPAPVVVLQRVGKISVTADWVITPGRSWPIADTNIVSHDQTTTTTHTPAWAIILVIVFIWFFLLSLFFLFAKETRVSGYISATAQYGVQSYSEQVPVLNAAARGDAMNRLIHIQSLIGWARNNRATRGA